MAKKLFVAAIEKNCGKTTTCLALMHLARKRYERVGFLKPFGGQSVTFRGQLVDKDVALMAEVFDLAEDPELMSPVVLTPSTTRDVIDGRITPEELQQKILGAAAELEQRCDLVIVEGSGHPGVGSIMGISNARIARILQTPVLLVTGGGLGNVVDRLALIQALFEKEEVDFRAVLVNKLIGEKSGKSLEYLRRALGAEPFQVLRGFDYHPVLANPTLQRIATLLDLPVQGDRSEVQRIVHRVLVGAASTQRITELITEPSLIIVTSSRNELLVTLAHLYHLPEYRPFIVGVVISGASPISPITLQILEKSEIPFIRAEQWVSAELYQMISRDVSKIVAEDREKLDLIRQLAEEHLNFGTMEEIFFSDRPLTW
ncbi:AAA family ATPase [Geomesophilobacter sediminis]|uniref:AAA family ATPase n=1 Tax=Geomesophilobacter sediminis TaxID=2798584 RepID=A0A8J7LZ82_9BACT|nr:AAA family ATPase [Geomesophilobacter sediminis]MBJ6726001.1 AAA family ATPase [Geomesophilobacter sediminis]